MKKILFLFAALAIYAGVNAQKPETVAIKATGMGLVVDGVLDEAIWADATQYPIESVFTGEEISGGDADCSGFFQIAWSDQGVYVAVTVTDDINQVDDAFGPNWAQDMVEIYFDMNVGNLADGNGTQEGLGHYQIAGKAIDGMSNWGTASQFAYKMDGASYVKETFVSWGDLKDVDGNVVTPSADIELGFDVYIIDNDADSVASERNYRDRLVWSNIGTTAEAWDNADDSGILTFDMETAVDNPFVTNSPKVAGIPLAIDGVLSESVWANASKYSIQQVFTGEEIAGGNADCSGYFQTAWNDQGVYVAVTVTDDINQTDDAFGPNWAQDMVEIYFDMNVGNLADGNGTQEGVGHHQIAGKAIDGVYTWGASSSFAYKLHGTSYVKEVFVSWDDLTDADGNVVAPSADIEIGFDVYIIDNDADSVASDRNYRDRLVWSNIGTTAEAWDNADDSGIMKFDTATVLESPAVASVSMVSGDSIVTDGVLEETVWADAQKLKIGQVFNGEAIAGGAADCSGFFQTVWNEQGIYVAVTVTDDINQTDDAFGPNWAQDMVEIYFDMNVGNLKDGNGTQENMGHYQVAGKAIDGVYTWGASSSYAYKLDGASYVKEAFVSWSDLADSDGNMVTPASGLELGFDVYIVDNDADSVASDRNYRDRLVWANVGNVAETWDNADDAGVITLSNTTIENVYEIVPDGIDQQMVSDIIVYPNPAKDVLYVRSVSEEVVISLLTVEGKMVMKSEGSNKINISSLQKGIYLVKINDQNTITTRRVIVK